MRHPPSYENVYCDHITLAYGCYLDKVSELVDKLSYAEVFAITHNDKIEAFRVLTDCLPDTYGFPHLTLSAVKGVKPFESVAMLQGKHEEVTIEPKIRIEGRIEFIPF